MPRPRLQKTLADYLAIAVTPVLIMLLVGSLVFFLQELFHKDGRDDRVRWILFWFVIGAVLVARIAMESGRAYASAFTLALAGATSLAIFKFSNSPLIPIVCLGIIWWCADKLTWDCTLIDDSEDASGEGLLQVAGVADEAEVSESNGDEVDATTTGEASPASTDNPEADEKTPIWKRLFLNESERKGKPHAPGLWVMFFSLAALPLFGFGQTMLASDSESRRFAFLCLFVYVAAALGLLMLTSFLGLRRYLRQRNLQMPTTMALTWVAMGSAIAVGILVACLVLPRPEGEYDVTAMVDQASEKVQEAADWAFNDEDGGEGEGKRSGQADENANQGAASDPNQQGQAGGTQGQQDGSAENAQDSKDGQQKGGEEAGNNPGEGEQRAGESQESGESGKPKEGGKNGEQIAENETGPKQPGRERASENESRPGEPPDPNSDENPNDHDAEQVAQNNGEDSPPGEDGESGSEADTSNAETPQTPDMSSALSKIGDLFKWIVYGIAALVIAFLVFKNWQAVSNFLLRLWAEFLSLFGRRQGEDEEHVEEAEPEAPVRPFAEFSNPFQSGAARRKSPSELVRYSFEALQAWAQENGCPRDPHQTPDEFGQQLKMRKVRCAAEGQEVSQLYARIAYTSHRAGDESLPVLEKLWRKMSA